jgi:hypothetical protein
MSGIMSIMKHNLFKEGEMKKVFLFSGKISSGKNQLAEYVGEIYSSKGKKVISDLFAADLKEWSKQDFKGLTEVLDNLRGQFQNEIYKLISNRHAYGLADDGITDNLFKLVNKLHISDDNWFENKTDITRTLLQIYGTQIFRNRVDDMYWIKRTKDRIIKYDADIILITDVRFPNEIDYIADSDLYETYSVRINRAMVRTGKEHEHISETSLDSYNEFSYVIDNNSGLSELKETAFGLVEDVENMEVCECQQA